MTIQQFIADHSELKISSMSVPTRPNDEMWGKDNKNPPFHYLVTLSLLGKIFQTYYSKGSAHVGRLINGEWKMLSQLSEQTRKDYKQGFSFNIKPIPPQLNEVLESLLMDVLGLDSAPLWPDYASELGMNVDSIKDKEVYESVVNIKLELQKLLGNTYKAFVACSPE